MSVLSCNRTGCENIMCDFYSSQYGYICNYCLDELKAKVPDISVEQFMRTPRGEDSVHNMMRIAAINFIESEFKMR